MDALYRELQQHLDRMPVAFPATASGVELRILQKLFTEQQARIALCLGAIGESPRAIHKRIPTLSLPELTAALAEMARLGLIETYGSPTKPRYGKSPFVVGIYERQVNRLTPDLQRDILAYLDEAFGKAVHTRKTPQIRTIPVQESIKNASKVALFDDIFAFVKASEGPFAVMNCICRQGKDLIGEPCRQTHHRENCLTFGEAARSMVDRGAARFITREDTLEYLRQADRDGLVLEPQNAQNPLFVCCCCGCCCGVLTSAKKLPHPAELFHSNYTATVEDQLCSQCGECLQRCQMDALSLDTGPALVDATRCIGCGLCVTTCPSGAILLKNNQKSSTPPKDTAALYLQLVRERYGNWGLARIAAGRLLGRPF
jgi:Fe-S-cluster-containing hydrogenase component 2